MTINPYIKFLISFVIANGIGAFFLWLTARELPLAQMRAAFAGADKGQLALGCTIFLLVYAVCHGARLERWRGLVRPLDASLPSGVITRTGLVGFTAILLLPLRLGELICPYLLSQRSRLSMSAVLGTAVVERVIDGLVMTGLLFVTLASYGGESSTRFALGAGAISAAIFIGALGFCLGAYWRRRQTVALVHRLFGWVSKGLSERLAVMLEAFIDGFRALVQAHTLGRFLGLTLLYWGSNVISMWLLARYGFGLQVGPWEMATVMALLVIGIMIPAGPAMAGNFEFFMTRAMGLFVVMEVFGAQVAAFAATLHVLQFLVIVLPGVAVMWFDPGSRNLIVLSEMANKEEGEEAAEVAREEGF